MVCNGWIGFNFRPLHGSSYGWKLYGEGYICCGQHEVGVGHRERNQSVHSGKRKSEPGGDPDGCYTTIHGDGNRHDQRGGQVVDNSRNNHIYWPLYSSEHSGRLLGDRYQSRRQNEVSRRYCQRKRTSGADQCCDQSDISINSGRRHAAIRCNGHGFDEYGCYVVRNRGFGFSFRSIYGTWCSWKLFRESNECRGWHEIGIGNCDGNINTGTDSRLTNFS